MYATNIFNIKFPSEYSYYESDYYVKVFFFLLKISWDKLVNTYCAQKPETLKSIFKKYIGYFNDSDAPLQHTLSTWRFRLYALSQCPNVFKNELSNMIYVIKTQRREAIQALHGPEYKHALEIWLSNNNQKQQEDYIKILLQFFKRLTNNTKDQKCKEIVANLIYSSISNNAAEKFKNKIKRLGIHIPPKETYFVEKSTNHIKEKDFNKIPISELIQKLQNEWDVDNLPNKQGLSVNDLEYLIKQRVKHNFKEMLESVDQFFNPSKISLFYFHALIQGLTSAMDKKNIEYNFSTILQIFKIITRLDIKIEQLESAKKNVNKLTNFKQYWLFNWVTINNAIIEFIEKVLEISNKHKSKFFKINRNLILAIIHNLLFKGPNNSFVDGENTNLFIQALNSVKGKAFKSFVSLTTLDGKRLKTDIKNMYKQLVEGESPDFLVFLYGYHTPVFYFRSKEWFRKNIFDNLFMDNNRTFKLPAIGGFLSQKSYQEIWEDKRFQKFYYELSKERNLHSRYKPFEDLGFSLFHNLAILYVITDTVLANKVKQIFQEANDSKRRYYFITMLGMIINEYKNSKKVQKARERLMQFWEWALKNISDANILSAFGFWLKAPVFFKLKDLVLNTQKTLQLSKGELQDRFGFLNFLSYINNQNAADKYPQEILEILRSYFLPQNSTTKYERYTLIGYRDTNKITENILRNIYKKPNYESEVEKLISALFDQPDGKIFWFLEKHIRQ